MSTTVFLDKLDFDGLCFARDEAQRRIDAKMQEQRLCVWEVVEDGMIMEHFAGYLAAAKCLYDRAVELSTASHLPDRSKELQLACKFVIASEFREYVPIGHA